MSFIINPFAVSPAGFGPDPSTLSNLELWLDANQLSLSDGDQVVTWTDFSGNSRDATGVLGVTTKPIFKATGGPNSRPAVRISGNVAGQTGWFTLPNFMTGFTSGQGLCVVKIDHDPPLGTSSAGPPFGDWGTAGDNYFPFDSDSVIYDDSGSTVRKTTVDPSPSLTSWRVYEFRSASGAWSNHLDGTQLFSTGTNTVGWNTAPLIGRSVTNSKILLGMIAEILLYSRVLNTSTERNAVIFSYWNNKYGFSLPTS